MAAQHNTYPQFSCRPTSPEGQIIQNPTCGPQLISVLHASLLPAKSNLKNSGQRPAKPSIKPTGAPSHTSQGSRSSSNKAAEMVLMGINRRGMSGPGMPNSGLSRYQTSCRHSNQHGCKVNGCAVLSSKDTGVASDQWLWGYRSSFMLCCAGLCREVRI